MSVKYEFECPEAWQEVLKDEFSSDYMAALKAFLAAEKKAGKVVFPEGGAYFRALDLTPPEHVKVVILGQDPYHGDGQAHGLAFSVPRGVKIPPSLRNIYKEIEADFEITSPEHGFLESWAQQGVLLLNSVLTVERGLAASHQGKGWERFTDAIIAKVNENTEPVVFMLWGSYAQKKAAFVESVDKGGRHLVLTAPHPSPLSAHRGFLGCGHFSKANAFLQECERGGIDWGLK